MRSAYDTDWVPFSLKIDSLLPDFELDPISMVQRPICSENHLPVRSWSFVLRSAIMPHDPMTILSSVSS